MTGKAKPPQPQSSKETLKHVKDHTRYITVPCPTCKKSGKRGNKICPLCEGEKYIQVPEEY